MTTKKEPVLKLILEHSRGGQRFFIYTVAASLINILSTFLIPQVIRFTVDSVIGTEGAALPGFARAFLDALGGRDFLRGNLILCALAVAFFALCAFIFARISQVNIARATEHFCKNLRDSLFSHIQRLSFKWHSEVQTGDIIQRCTSDVETLQNFVSVQLLEVMRTVILIAVALSLMFSMNATLALLCLATIPVIVLYSLLFHGRILRQFRSADEAEGELMTDIQENLTGVRVVRAFGRERFEQDKFEKKLEKFTNDWVNLGYTLGFYWGIGDLVSCLQLLIMICVGSMLAAGGSLTLGEFLTFVTYTQILSAPVRNLGRTLSELSKATVSVDRLRDILDTEPERDAPDDTEPDLSGDIEFQNVSFSYGGPEILKNLSFRAEGGKVLGILGATGSGKSTLAALINRLYELPEDCGSITIGGTDIRTIRRAHLRRNVGLILQEPFLFSRSVEDNILIAAPSPSRELARQTAKIAAVSNDIELFKDGYGTIVGERGVTLSGGQKQRVAIARTLAANCPIVIFDDSMSNLDMETDAVIRKSLRGSTAGTTSIIISHRINTLMTADHILVLDDGRLVEQGSHRELIARDGLYRRVYLMQSDAGLLNPEVTPDG